MLRARNVSHVVPMQVGLVALLAALAMVRWARHQATPAGGPFDFANGCLFGIAIGALLLSIRMRAARRPRSR